jgi:hypothetical protein
MCASPVSLHGEIGKPLTCLRCRHRFDAPAEGAEVKKGGQKKAPDARKVNSPLVPSKMSSEIPQRKSKPKKARFAAWHKWLYIVSGVLVALFVSFGIFWLVFRGWGESLTVDDVSGFYINEKDPAYFLIIDARGLCKFTHSIHTHNEGYNALVAYKIRGKTLYLSVPGGSKDANLEALRNPRAFLRQTSSFLTVEDSALVSSTFGRFLRVELDCISPSGTLRPGPVKHGAPRTERAASGRPMARAVNPGQRSATSWTAVSADGSVFVAAQENGCIGVWDPNTGQPIAGWESNFAVVEHPCLSPDGNRLAFLSDATTPEAPNLRIMNPRTGEFLNQPVLIRGVRQGPVGSSAMAYSSDGDQLIVSTSQGMKILDGELGSELHHREMGRVTAFVLLPEGDTCLALCGARGSVTLPSTLVWCNLETGSTERRLDLPAGREYERLALSTDGTVLALSGRAAGKGFIEVRSTSAGEVIGQVEVTANIGPFGFINAGKSLIAVQGGGPTEWDASSCVLVRRRMELPVTWFGQISGPANRVMTVTGRLDGGGPRFFDFATGKELGAAD